MTLASLLLGLAFTLVGGFVVKPSLACLRNQFKIPRISRSRRLQTMWKRLYTHPDPSGEWVGHVERIYFFFALAAHSWEAVGIWLVFKLGSKWEAWNQMGYVPDQPVDGQKIGGRQPSVHPLRWAYARRIWAAMGYGTFVVGTAMNLFLAGLGLAIASDGGSLLATLQAIQVDLAWKK